VHRGVRVTRLDLPQRLGGQPKKRLHDCLRLDLCQSMKMPPRRFPPPWSVEDIGAAFVVTTELQRCAAHHG